MTYAKRWKFLDETSSGVLKSRDHTWTLGDWSTVSGRVSLCENGFHASKNIREAFSYVQGNVLARVEVKGDHEESDDKSVHQSMRLIKAYRWTKSDSVALAIFTAKLVLENFERVFPDDDRPRKAIEAAVRWLDEPTAENESAAWSAAESAAWSAASAARSAARSARSAAESAAWSAASAARSAARSARSAAWSAAESAAWSAAESAAKKELFDKIEEWMVARVVTLEEIGAS